MIELKKKILSQVEQMLMEKAAQMRKQLEAIREDASGSAKSSMGDKYETTREMLKQEELKVTGQLDICEKQIKQVQLAPVRVLDKVGNGSLIRSADLYFMILTSVGKVSIDDKDVFVVSAAAPVAQTLLGHNLGDTFIFNGKSCQIDELA